MRREDWKHLDKTGGERGDGGETGRSQLLSFLDRSVILDVPVSSYVHRKRRNVVQSLSPNEMILSITGHAVRANVVCDCSGRQIRSGRKFVQGQASFTSVLLPSKGIRHISIYPRKDRGLIRWRLRIVKDQEMGNEKYVALKQVLYIFLQII